MRKRTRLLNDRIIVCLPGATTKVATLKKALTKAEDKAAKELIEREKHEARVGEVQQELQALMTKHEALELDSKTESLSLLRPLRAQRVPRPRPRRPSRRLRQ